MTAAVHLTKRRFLLYRPRAVGGAALVAALAVLGFWVQLEPGPSLPEPSDAPPLLAGDDSTLERLRSSSELPLVAQRLQTRLTTSPDDAEGWALLARTQAKLGHLDEAVQAFQRASSLRPKDVSLLVDHADALALVNRQSLEGEPTRLLEVALQLDPLHPGALSLSGLAAFDRKDYTGAITLWERSLANMPQDSPARMRLSAGLIEARRRLGAQH